jgi:hypothetical protein
MSGAGVVGQPVVGGWEQHATGRDGRGTAGRADGRWREDTPGMEAMRVKGESNARKMELARTGWSPLACSQCASRRAHNHLVDREHLSLHQVQPRAIPFSNRTCSRSLLSRLCPNDMDTSESPHAFHAKVLCVLRESPLMVEQTDGEGESVFVKIFDGATSNPTKLAMNSERMYKVTTGDP